MFMTCWLGLKIGFPATFMMFKFNAIKVLLVTCSGGIAGSIFFTYLSAAILKAWHNYRAKRHLIHRKRIFTSFNRRIIRIKNRFGLAGIAFVTPIFLSTPVGAFVAERFFRDKKKIILYLSAATIFWSFTLYFVVLFFYDSVKGWML